MATPAIEFREVRKIYHRMFSEERVAALSGISFEAVPGEICAFLGPNGAGKTTSINILMGFLFPDSGEVRVLGYPPGDVRAKQQIGFVPENFAFHKYLSGPGLLEYHLALSGSSDGQALIPELLARVKLSGYENLKIGKYSRGMVQRLGIAQALLADPQLLVLDEPTSGLDPAGREEILQLLQELRAAGKTVFVSSHILPEVEQVCDRVIIIDRGRLVRAGRLNEIVTASNEVEIEIDALPENLAPAFADRGVSVQRSSAGMRLLAPADRKREVIEMLWAEGADVISVNPVKSSLQDVFLQLVKDYEKVP